MFETIMRKKLMINETSRYDALYLEINNRTPEILPLLIVESTHIQEQVKWNEQSTLVTSYI